MQQISDPMPCRRITLTEVDMSREALVGTMLVDQTAMTSPVRRDGAVADGPPEPVPER